MSIQGNWPISLKTPLGEDVLIPESYSAMEGISQTFLLSIVAVAENSANIAFDQLLGQPVTLKLHMATDAYRIWNGIVSRIVQADRSFDFTTYHLEVVPKLWLLNHRSGCRIFQQQTIPDILKAVLTGLDVSYQLVGTYEPRDYCVQYRESDLDFASRLMEDEGIFYFFKHTDGGHQMVVADSAASHQDVPGEATLHYYEVRGGTRKKDIISHWEKSQEIRSGKVTLWDHSFELPGNHLETDKTPQETVTVGKTTHKLKLSVSDPLEVYDYPGGYAHRFDGIDPGGGERSSDVQKIFTDNKRTVGLRMQEETAQGLIFRAKSDCRQITSGNKFELADHFSDDSKYLIISAEHSASHPLGTERTVEAFEYSNSFKAIPMAIPYRPPRVTEVPTVLGAQTAVVVGPSGEEIFTDKYGRVKVQFPWDRQGKKDANSSCWLRVGTPWAGKQWGFVHLPRIGQEVLVDFLEGDPDRPYIMGSVYNADQMPPYELPANKTQSGVKSRSSLNGGSDNYNEIRFEDKMGSEQILIHAEKDLQTEVEHDETRTVGNDRTTTIKNNDTKTVSQGNESTTISQGNQSLSIKVGNQDVKLDLGQSTTEAMQSIELKVGQSSVKLDQTGVTIKGMMISIEGQVQVDVKGLMTNVNGDAMLVAKGGVVMIN